MRRRYPVARILLVAALPLLAVLPEMVAAQQVGIAAVLPVASPTATGTRGLAFGDITPAAGTQAVNVPAARDPLSATSHAGEYLFDVSTSAGVAFEMSVPVQLTGGATPLDVSFNDELFGGWCVTTSGSACTMTSFNPAAGAVHACARPLGIASCRAAHTWAAGSTLAVYIGGVLTVTPDALPGTYEGTVTLTITQVY